VRKVRVLPPLSYEVSQGRPVDPEREGREDSNLPRESRKG
jgi:hypothetical protein